MNMSHMLYQAPPAPQPNPGPTTNPERKSPRLVVIVITVIVAVLVGASFWTYWVLRKPLPNVMPPEVSAPIYSLSGTVRKIGTNEITIRMPETAIVNGETFINYKDKKILISPATEVVRMKIDSRKQTTFSPAQMKDIIFDMKLIVSALPVPGSADTFQATKIMIGE